MNVVKAFRIGKKNKLGYRAINVILTNSRDVQNTNGGPKNSLQVVSLVMCTGTPCVEYVLN